MSTNTISSIASIRNMYKLQTRLFKNATAGISDEDARSKLSGTTNHIAWLTGHIVSSRFMIANLLGITDQEPYPEIFGKGKGIQDIAYPSMVGLISSWDSISEKLIDVLGETSEDQLSGKAPFQTPIDDMSLGGLVTFFAHHEAYTIGQIGLSRRFFGYEPMKYN